MATSRVGSNGGETVMCRATDDNDEPRRALAKRMGHAFGDETLLTAALTHRSYANEKGLETNYERLEFLGDAVLDLVAAEWLYARYPAATEGKLTRQKSYLVSEPVLARTADGLGLGEMIQLGVGEARSGGRSKPSLLADALEAVIGALYLDAGLPKARAFVGELLEAAEAAQRESRFRDAKSMLQETLQAEGRALPRYVLTASEGPDHEKSFTVECRVRSTLLGTGAGRSKKHAEQAAAEAALRQLESDEA
jgi:ribonuclease III